MTKLPTECHARMFGSGHCKRPVELELECRMESACETCLRDCRGLVLAMVAKHRCAPGDALPDGRQALRNLLDALLEGPPWPALDTVMPSSLQLG